MAESAKRRAAPGAQGLALASLALAALPALVWWQSVGDIGVYVAYETPPGQVSYVLSKLAGMYAVTLLWAQVLLALIRDTSMARGLPSWGLRFHRTLGLTTFAVLLLHVALFVTAASIRQSQAAFGLLLPHFSEGFYAFAVSLGVLGLYAIAATVAAGFARARGIRVAIWLHRISVLAFALTLTHCLLIGTETRSLLMLLVYALMAVTLLAALVRRLARR